MRRKISMLLLFMVCGLISFVAYTQAGLGGVNEDWYDWWGMNCPCEDRYIEVGYLNETGEEHEYPQDWGNQWADWEDFAYEHDLDVNTDLIGYETRTYDCHSYVFRGSDGWLRGDWAEEYLIWENPSKKIQQLMRQEEDGCYYCENPEFIKIYLNNNSLDVEEGRWIWFTNDHSCEYNWDGKCEDKFLCKRTDKVYNMCGAYSCYGPPANPNKIIK